MDILLVFMICVPGVLLGLLVIAYLRMARNIGPERRDEAPTGKTESDDETPGETSPEFVHSGFNTSAVAPRISKLRKNYLHELQGRPNLCPRQKRLTARARQALGHFAFFQRRPSAPEPDGPHITCLTK